jgi:hypothetical protein
MSNNGYFFYNSQSPFFQSNPYIFVLPTSSANALFDALIALLVLYKYEFLIMPVSVILLSFAAVLWMEKALPQISIRNGRKPDQYGRVFWYSLLFSLSAEIFVLSVFSLGIHVSLMLQISDALIVLTILIVLLVPLLNGLHERGFGVSRVEISASLLFFPAVLSFICALSYLMTIFSPFSYVPVPEIMFLLPAHLVQYPGSLFYPGFIALMFAVNILTYIVIITALKWILRDSGEKHQFTGKTQSNKFLHGLARLRHFKILKVAIVAVIVIIAIPIAINVPVSHPVLVYNVLFAPVYSPGILPVHKGQEIIATSYNATVIFNVSKNSTLVGAWTSPSGLSYIGLTRGPPQLKWGGLFLYPLFNGTFNISLTPGVYYLVFHSFLLGYNTIVYVTNTIRLIPETK